MVTCTLKQTEGLRTWGCFGSKCSSGHSEGLFCVSTWKSDAREGYPGVPLSLGCSTLGAYFEIQYECDGLAHPGVASQLCLPLGPSGQEGVSQVPDLS